MINSSDVFGQFSEMQISDSTNRDSLSDGQRTDLDVIISRYQEGVDFIDERGFVLSAASPMPNSGEEKGRSRCSGNTYGTERSSEVRTDALKSILCLFSGHGRVTDVSSDVSKESNRYPFLCMSEGKERDMSMCYSSDSNLSRIKVVSDVSRRCVSIYLRSYAQFECGDEWHTGALHVVFILGSNNQRVHYSVFVSNDRSIWTSDIHSLSLTFDERADNWTWDVGAVLEKTRLIEVGEGPLFQSPGLTDLDHCTWMRWEFDVGFGSVGGVPSIILEFRSIGYESTDYLLEILRRSKLPEGRKNALYDVFHSVTLSDNSVFFSFNLTDGTSLLLTKDGRDTMRLDYNFSFDGWYSDSESDCCMGIGYHTSDCYDRW